MSKKATVRLRYYIAPGVSCNFIFPTVEKAIMRYRKARNASPLVREGEYSIDDSNSIWYKL